LISDRNVGTEKNLQIPPGGEGLGICKSAELKFIATSEKLGYPFVLEKISSGKQRLQRINPDESN